MARLRGDEGIRTLDPLLARQVLSQLSYTPVRAGHLVLLFQCSLFRNLFLLIPMGLSGPFPILKDCPSGLKWTRTTDLTLIRRAL